MIPSSQSPDFSHLSTAERIIVVEEIWDSIAVEQTETPLTPAQQTELDRRLQAYRNSPDAGDSWEAVKSRIQAKS